MRRECCSWHPPISSRTPSSDRHAHTHTPPKGESVYVCKSVSLYVSVERKKEAKKERSVDIWLLFMAYQPFVLRIMCQESVATVSQGHLASDA